ncbi:MAG: SRPBCC family protein [Myxococcota bacterium]
MREVTARARIALPQATCWEKLCDFTRALEYVPGLTSLEVTTEQREGVGASRVVVHETTGAMNETVTEWTEGQGFWMRLHRGEKGPMPPLREAQFRYWLEAQGADACDIVLTLRYALGLGPLGALLDALFLRRTLAKNLLDTALALAEHYETGARVTPEKLAARRARAA